MPKARSIYKEKVLGLDVDLCHLPRKCKALVLCPIVHKKNGLFSSQFWSFKRACHWCYNCSVEAVIKDGVTKNMMAGVCAEARDHKQETKTQVRDLVHT
jgi:hypothetical protein